MFFKKILLRELFLSSEVKETLNKTNFELDSNWKGRFNSKRYRNLYQKNKNFLKSNQSNFKFLTKGLKTQLYSKSLLDK